MTKLLECYRKHKVKVWIALAVWLALSLLVAVARAQSSCGSYTCVYTDDFETDTGEWELSGVVINPNTVLEWVESKTIGILIWATSAQGVLHGQLAADSWTIERDYELQPGVYYLLFRASPDGYCGSCRLTVWRPFVPGVQSASDLFSRDLGSGFAEYLSDPFTVTTPGNYSFEFNFDRGNLYLDYIYLVQSTAPTPTPGAGTPSATAVSATGTPIPTYTPNCIAATPTPTTGPAQYTAVAASATPNTTATATPTSTSSGWSVLDQFDGGGVSLNPQFWKTIGSGISSDQSGGYSGNISAFVPNSVDLGAPQTVLTRTALVYERNLLLTTPFYLSAWVRARYLPAGATQTVEIWSHEADTGGYVWHRLAEFNVSTTYWYPVYVPIESVEPGTQVAAIAVTAHRSDDSTSGGINLDDWYLYSSADRAPICGGSYFSGSDTSWDQLGIAETESIVWRADKDCPTPVLVPDNFWGPLLAELTIFTDRITALWPGHQPGSLVEVSYSLIASPVISLALIASMLLDLRVPLTMGLVVLMMESLRGLFSVLRFVYKLIPMAG